jgi:hypothetical protein
MSKQPATSDIKARMDIFEAELACFPQVHVPVVHRFTDGMYIREVHVPKGVIFTSRTHKTQHPFVISAGVATILNEKGERVIVKAPFTGITEPGTRRIFVVHMDMVLTTFHRTDITDPDAWVDEHTEMENRLLPEGTIQNCFEGRRGLVWRP